MLTAATMQENLTHLLDIAPCLTGDSQGALHAVESVRRMTAWADVFSSDGKKFNHSPATQTGAILKSQSLKKI